MGRGLRAEQFTPDEICIVHTTYGAALRSPCVLGGI